MAMNWEYPFLSILPIRAPVNLGYTDSKATVYLGYTYCQVPSPNLKKWQ
jgi:hypothetical protein